MRAMDRSLIALVRAGIAGRPWGLLRTVTTVGDLGVRVGCSVSLWHPWAAAGTSKQRLARRAAPPAGVLGVCSAGRCHRSPTPVGTGRDALSVSGMRWQVPWGRYALVAQGIEQRFPKP